VLCSWKQHKDLLWIKEMKKLSQEDDPRVLNLAQKEQMD
jgi:hypothetical protein